MVGTEPWFYIHKAHSFQGTWCWCRHRRMIHIGRSSAASTRNWVLPRNPSSSFIPIPLCRQFNPVCWAWMRDRRWRRTRGQGFAVRLSAHPRSCRPALLPKLGCWGASSLEPEVFRRVQIGGSDADFQRATTTPLLHTPPLIQSPFRANQFVLFNGLSSIWAYDSGPGMPTWPSPLFHGSMARVSCPWRALSEQFSCLAEPE